MVNNCRGIIQNRNIYKIINKYLVLLKEKNDINGIINFENNF